jgi:hypothetical protein
MRLYIRITSVANADIPQGMIISWAGSFHGMCFMAWGHLSYYGVVQQGSYWVV